MPQNNYYFNQAPVFQDPSKISGPSDHLTQYSKALTGFNAERNLNLKTQSDDIQVHNRRKFNQAPEFESSKSDNVVHRTKTDTRIRREIDMIVQDDETKTNLSSSQISLINNPENYYDLNYQYVRGEGWDVSKPTYFPP